MTSRWQSFNSNTSGGGDAAFVAHDLWIDEDILEIIE